MSVFGTETYSSQSGGLATFSHRSHHQRQPLEPIGGAFLHLAPRHTTTTTTTPPTIITTQQQLQQQSQQQQQTTLEQQDQLQLQQQQQQQLQPTSVAAAAALFSSNLLNSFNGYDVIDNKTSESIPIYIQKHQRYIMNDIFHREDERLKTFDTWPLDWMDKNLLAQTGMFYTGEDDKVKCYFCEVEIGRWEHSDHPVSEHLRWFSNCPLLRRRTTNNVPIDAEALDRVLPPISYDICGANESSVGATMHGPAYDGLMLSSVSTHFMSLTANTTNTTSTATASGCGMGVGTVTSSQTYYPEYPEYAIEAARLRSFAEWPRHMRQKPEQLAEAGFFYIGTGDRVKCFSCGGGLKDWADEDEPWEQHTLWMSKCRFLKLMKGQNYIDSVLSKQQKAKDAASSTGDADASSNKAPTPADAALLAISSKLASPVTVATATATATALTVGATASLEVGIGGGIGTDVVGPVTVTACHKQETTSSPPCTDIGSEAVLGGGSNLATCGNDKRVSSTGCIPEEKLCKICYADEYNTAFLPCGHVVACAKCASSVTKCPLCRKPFTDVMRVYFS